jgi:predicted DCC family thiol-disulfide oxidoreductase YuxK
MEEHTPILIFYDGHCSVCIRGNAYFAKLDNGRGIIQLIDFRSEPDAPQRAGVDADTLTAALHAKLPTGELLSGNDAIRTVMDALGHGWQARWTRWPIIQPVADLCYRIFAKHRLRFFRVKHSCDERCEIPPLDQ